MQATNSVYVTKKFACSIHDLFNWVVDPKLVSQWFGPRQYVIGSVEINLSVGGQYSIELISATGSRFSIEGEYIEIDRPNHLKFSFQYVGLTNTPPKSTVEITLEEISPSSSKLKLVQKFEITPKDIATRKQAWKKMFDKLYKTIS